MTQFPVLHLTFADHNVYVPFWWVSSVLGLKSNHLYTLLADDSFVVIRYVYG